MRYQIHIIAKHFVDRRCQGTMHFMGFERTFISHIIVILFCLSMLDNDDDMAEIELIYDDFDPKGQVPLS